MSTEADLPTPATANEDRRAQSRAAASNALIRLAVDYNDVLDRCTQSGGANIDDLMDLFADGATWTVVGATSLAGKAAIREMFLERVARYRQVVEIRGIELWGDLVICRVERRDTTFVQAGGEKQIRILLVKDEKIEQAIVVFDPDPYADMRGGASAASQALDAFGGGDRLEGGERRQV